MTDPYCVRTTKRPLSGRDLGHVTKFRNFGTRIITFERIERDIRVTWPNPALKGRIAYLPVDVTSTVNDMFINKNKTTSSLEEVSKKFPLKTTLTSQMQI